MATKEPKMGEYNHSHMNSALVPPEDMPEERKYNPYGGSETGGEYGAGSENGILDLSNDTALDSSNQGYKGQPGLFMKRGHDPIEVDPGSVPYPMEMENDKPKGSPAGEKVG